MHITMLALGSRGDVQPFIALGQRLQARGHTIKIAAAYDYQALIEGYGLRFHGIAGSVYELIDPQTAPIFQGRFGHPIAIMRHYFNVVSPLLDRIVNDCWEAGQDADALVVSTLGRYCGDPIIQQRNIPFHVCHFHPNAPTNEHPHIFFPDLPRWMPFTGSYNRLSYTLTEVVFWLFLQRALNRLRKRHKLPQEWATTTWQRHQHLPDLPLHAYSRHLAPPPHDWPDPSTITGFWFIEPEAWQPPPELVRFLADGAPPLLFAFGSIMVGEFAPTLTDWVIQTARGLGERALIFRGWDELGRADLPNDMLLIGSTSHQWLLPQVRAVIHHGGSGTTAACLQAQTPAWVMPFLGDQYFWGQALYERGVSPKPISRTHISLPKMYRSVEALLQPQYQARTHELGTLIQQETGLANAVRLIER